MTYGAVWQNDVQEDSIPDKSRNGQTREQQNPVTDMTTHLAPLKAKMAKVYLSTALINLPQAILFGFVFLSKCNGNRCFFRRITCKN